MQVCQKGGRGVYKARRHSFDAFYTLTTFNQSTSWLSPLVKLSLLKERETDERIINRLEQLSWVTEQKSTCKNISTHGNQEGRVATAVQYVTSMGTHGLVIRSYTMLTSKS